MPCCLICYISANAIPCMAALSTSCQRGKRSPSFKTQTHHCLAWWSNVAPPLVTCLLCTFSWHCPVLWLPISSVPMTTANLTIAFCVWQVFFTHMTLLHLPTWWNRSTMVISILQMWKVRHEEVTELDGIWVQTDRFQRLCVYYASWHCKLPESTESSLVLPYLLIWTKGIMVHSFHNGY